MPLALFNGRVLTTDGFRTDLAVVLDGSSIAALLPVDRIGPDLQMLDLEGGVLSPGFIDTQVNGGGGVLFNDAPTVQTLRTMAQAHRRSGVTGFLPTLISDDLDVVDRGMRAVEAAIDLGVSGVLGIHVEGPFLNVARKGIHDAAKFRTLDDGALELLSSLRRGKTLVTLAPERTRPEMLQALVERGVIVSAGHTDATYEETRLALASGMSGFTHLFNAMSPLQSRKPGVVGAALEDQSAWCGIIVDGHHVDPATLRIAFRARPIDRFMLVSDAMPPAATDMDSFVLNGRYIQRQDGAYLDEAGVLAGADLTLIEAVQNAVALAHVDYADALRMASSSPAAFLGMSSARGTIMAGAKADLTLIGRDGRVMRTWIDGLEDEPSPV